MPCTKCSTEFTLLTWKIKCTDCELYYCSKCLRRMHGSLYCEKCVILNKRPPDREKLMELRAKDLQDYLNKHHISTHGLVEKSELVELFFRRAIPVGNKKTANRLTSVLSGSVPNIAAQGQDQINNLKSNLNNMRSYAEHTLHNLGRKIGPHDGENNPEFSCQGQTFESFVSADVPLGQQNNVSVNTSVRTEAYSDNPQPTSSNNQPETFTEPSKSTPPPTKYPKLSDFNSVEELNDLSVKQLKGLLSLNRVNFKGCVEKTELLDRAKCLWNDSVQNKKGFDDSSLENVCKICMDAPLDCVLLECGHVATCIECGKQLAECPICRQFVIRVVRTFKA